MQALAQLLELHVPPAAVPYCLQLWQENPFRLVLRNPRATKLGDFSCLPGRSPRITINNDSHPYSFLLTYLHEVAHLQVHKRVGFASDPHGKEWKETFRNLCLPLFDLRVFPDDLTEALRDHLVNPTASSFSDARLSQALQAYDDRLHNALRLADLPEGSQFQLHGRWFQKGKLKRTRVICRELSSRRTYLITAHALIGA